MSKRPPARAGRIGGRGRVGAPRRRALVTGASSGIGLELARRLAAAGYDLDLVGRDEDRLSVLAEELATAGRRATPLVVDLAVPRELAAFAEYAGSVAPDVLVNNAGFGDYGPFAASVEARDAAMIATNVAALTLLTRAALPHMLARGSGRILNVASTAAFAPGAFAAVYAATKAYVLSFSEAVAEEVQGTGVTVTALCPGPTATRFAARSGLSAARIFRGRVASPEAVAQIGFDAMMAGRRVAVAGLLNQLLVLAVRFAPRSLVARAGRRAYSPPD